MAQRQSMALLTSMDTGKWYTPPWYLDLVREVFSLGAIDLDPASDIIANQIVRANRYYTVEDDGLSLDWEATNTFLNPPYSIEGQRVASTSVWITKALREYRLAHYLEGIYLVNAKLGYKWFNQLLDGVDTFVILHRQRIGFVDPGTLLESKPSRQPQASIYVGPNYQNFGRVFDSLGWRIRS